MLCIRLRRLRRRLLLKLSWVVEVMRRCFSAVQRLRLSYSEAVDYINCHSSDQPCYCGETLFAESGSLSAKDIVRRENRVCVLAFLPILLFSGFFQIANSEIPMVEFDLFVVLVQVVLVSFIYVIGLLGVLQLYHMRFHALEDRWRYLVGGCILVGLCYFLLELANALTVHIAGGA